MTPQHFQTIPTSCVILPTMYTTKLSYMHTGLFTPTKSTHQQGTQHCSFHSLLHTKKKQYLPCSAATKVHNITDTPTHHTDSALLMYSTLPLHTRQTITAMLIESKKICSTHSITHSQCTSTCSTHPALPTTLPSTTLCTQLTNTRHSWQNGTRCRDGGKVSVTP